MKNILRTRRAPLSAALLTTASILAACGGGGGGDGAGAPPAPTTVTLSGVAADGLLSGAIACYDLDDNGICGPSEPSSVASDSDGRFTLTIDPSDAGKHAVIVNVPPTAIDKDTGIAVGTGFTIKAPATGAAGAGTLFVSPLTTLVVERMAASGSNLAEATALIQSQLGLAASPLANFVADADAQAALMARVVNQVGIEVARLATAAGVPADQARALIAATTMSNLPTLAAQAAAATGSSAQVATQIAADTLAERNLSATTVVAQAQVAAQIAAPPAVAAAASGPFVSLRNFTYTSPSDYSYRIFTGDSSQLSAGGEFDTNEIRRTIVGGVAQPYNRNVAYWTGSAWKVCEREYRMNPVKPATATTPQVSRYCEASVSESRDATRSIAGEKMADVIAEIRAFPLADSTGLPTNFGPPPALLGNAVFPADSTLSTREQVQDVGTTDYYILTDRPRVLPSFRQAAVLEGLKTMTGEFVDAAAVVSGSNSVYLADAAVAQTTPGLKPVRRYRAAFNPANDAVRFFACDVRVSDNGSQNCTVLGDGSSAITTRADSRVLKFTRGYPAALAASSKRQRFFVQRDGVVFSGYTNLQQTVYQKRLNTPAWIALRDELGIPVHTDPVAPVANPPLDFLRSFTYSDASNYNYRVFRGNGVADGTGTYTADDARINVSGGMRIPFAFNSEFWTGTDWHACPNDLVGVLRYTHSPRASTYCRSFVSTSTAPVVVTLDGRNMSEVIQDVRWYPSKDGTFDFASYGPSPGNALLQAGTFPPGSTMYFQRIDQTREPEQVFLGTGNQVRIAPANANVPFDTWPFAITLDGTIAAYPGNYFGGPVNGSTELSVWNYFQQSTDPAYTNFVDVRVQFDANGQKARFFRNNRLVSTGNTTHYVPLLDTTYSITTVGGRRILSFAQMPAEVTDRGGFERKFAEFSGAVFYASQTIIFPGGQHTIRFNGVASEAMRAQLGLVAP